jgi:CIC family chloride channel protein
VTGFVTGLGVVGFEKAVRVFLDPILTAPLWLAALAPTLGLLGAALALRWLARGASPSTADEYIRSVHLPDQPLELRPVPGRLVAALATLGAGGAMGLEGPSIYLGAGAGTAIQQTGRLRRDAGSKVLMVAGAAAGVSAIFRAPLTGAVFALEVPYRDDLARRLLLPALLGAATGYLARVIFEGTERLFPVDVRVGLGTRELVGAIALGAIGGLVARVVARLLREAKRVAATTPAWARIVVGGAALAGCALVADAVTGAPLTIGPGYDVIAWVQNPKLAIGVVVGLLALRIAATSATVGAGGAGGLFIPLVVFGALLGRAVGGVVAGSDLTMFTVIGVASVLGAGYRVPLAAVVFVAETTGRAEFVIPGLLAAVAAELVVGHESVTAYQRP